MLYHAVFEEKVDYFLTGMKNKDQKYFISHSYVCMCYITLYL